MDNTMEYSHSDYDYTTIKATWEPQYSIMAELPDDTLRTTCGFDDAIEDAATDAANEIHEWIGDLLHAAQPFNYSTTEGDYTQSVTHEWSGAYLKIEVYLGGFYDAPSVEIEYDGISDEAGEQMEDTTMMDEMMEAFEQIISEKHSTGTDYKGEPVKWVTTISERISEITAENFYETLWQHCVRFDEGLWYDDRTATVVDSGTMAAMAEDYAEVLTQLADDDALYIPDSESIDEDGNILLSTLSWWEGNTNDIGSRDGYSELPTTAAARLRVLEYLQASQGVICVPRADCHHTVAKKTVTYKWEASADADDIKAANGYIFDLSMVVDAEFFSEAA